MTFKQFFYQYIAEERGVNKLYHFAHMNKISNIILHNKFVLTYVSNDPDGGDDAGDIYSNSPGKYNFYMSLSRIPFGGYNIENSNIYPQAIIEFDRDRLRQNYKIVPFNYYRAEKNYDPIKYRYTDENEDRIISNKSIIPNAIRYISRVIFYFPKGETGELQMTHRHTKLTFKELKDAGVDFEIYRDHKNFRNLKNPDIKNDISWFDLDKEYGRHFTQLEMPTISEPFKIPEIIEYLKILRGDESTEESITNFLKLKFDDLLAFIENLRTQPIEKFKNELQLLAKYIRQHKTNIQKLFNTRQDQLSNTH
jgi:hypothetical protein